MRRLLCILLLSAWALPASAAFKCDEGGVTVYSDTPCPGAAPLRLEKGKAPPADADKRLEQDKKAVREMQRNRRRHEARLDKEQQRAARAAAVRERRCVRLARELRWAEQDAAAAAGKRAPRARQKAQRAAETYQETCRHREGLQIGTGT
ncbi:DUF4124 domain-containing protein [Noviherbaspirillum aridicola]|uniref:DUF4124 domain-containing protein n=1 Tax=Noviherbaspirillum aridicola TaxID=2849687 RepID=A0ABQ4Q5Q5_9BURK|nr:DUF4124 domain-containing protein [Noviherbaspirillum aridicola]GIZ52389.1 hypothetical protein NCCP691_24030 [Noviherbaspirillum aridicola]